MSRFQLQQMLVGGMLGSSRRSAGDCSKRRHEMTCSCRAHVQNTMRQQQKDVGVDDLQNTTKTFQTRSNCVTAWPVCDLHAPTCCCFGWWLIVVLMSLLAVLGDRGPSKYACMLMHHHAARLGVCCCVAAALWPVWQHSQLLLKTSTCCSQDPFQLPQHTPDQASCRCLTWPVSLQRCLC